MKLNGASAAAASVAALMMVLGAAPASAVIPGQTAGPYDSLYECRQAEQRSGEVLEPCYQLSNGKWYFKYGFI